MPWVHTDLITPKVCPLWRKWVLRWDCDGGHLFKRILALIPLSSGILQWLIVEILAKLDKKVKLSGVGFDKVDQSNTKSRCAIVILLYKDVLVLELGRSRRGNNGKFCNVVAIAKARLRVLTLHKDVLIRSVIASVLDCKVVTLLECGRQIGRDAMLESQANLGER